MSTTAIIEARQYLTFQLEGEVFAADVSQIREILDYSKITKVPKTPDFLRGVINLRGSVVPVVDMRLKMGMSAIEKTVDTCIVVMEIHADDETTVMGALVDSVQEVFEIEPDQIEPPPKIGLKLKTDFIQGMGKRQSGFIMILDIDKVFSLYDLALAQDLASSL